MVTSVNPAAPDLRRSLQQLGESALRFTASRLLGYVERAEEAVEEAPSLLDAKPEGVPERATAEAVKAAITHHNPAWAAVKGAWLGADAKTRAVAVAVLLLLALLAPVLLLLLLVAALVVAAVAAIRAAAKS